MRTILELTLPGQAEHEQLTGIFKRVQRLARQNQATIKKLQMLTTEETLELGRLGRVRGDSEEVLAKTEGEVKALESEEMALRAKVEKAEGERRALEEEVVALLREQVRLLTCHRPPLPGDHGEEHGVDRGEGEGGAREDQGDGHGGGGDQQQAGRPGGEPGLNPPLHGGGEAAQAAPRGPQQDPRYPGPHSYLGILYFAIRSRRRNQA